MTNERRPEGPRNIVGLNRYERDRRERLSPELVCENWYIARLINPQAEDIGNYAADILMRVMRVTKLKSGAIKVYATPASHDSLLEPAEADAVPMDRDGYFTEGGTERGYLLGLFSRAPKNLGNLAAAAALEA